MRIRTFLKGKIEHTKTWKKERMDGKRRQAMTFENLKD